MKQIEASNSNLQKRLEELREMKNGISQKGDMARSALEAETDLVKRTEESLQKTRELNEELIKQINDKKALK